MKKNNYLLYDFEKKDVYLPTQHYKSNIKFNLTLSFQTVS